MKSVYRITIALLLMMVQGHIMGTDMDFGLFQYSGSRLKKITRWVGNKDEKRRDVVYQYDENGYLRSRKMTQYYREWFCEKSVPEYETSIEYDLSNSSILETVNRYWRGQPTAPIKLTYFYNEKNLLIRYQRFDSTIYNYTNFSLSRDVEIKYNNKTDLIFIKDNAETAPGEPFYPGNGLALGGDEVEFKYEYSNELKIRYKKLREDLWDHDGEFIFRNNKLNLYQEYINKEKNIIDKTNQFVYDTNNNIISNIINKYYENPNMKGLDIVSYQYDSRNRIINKKEYFIENNEIKSVLYVEEYEYENGPYVHYPYLLPTTKINIYDSGDEYSQLDKFMF